jgi:hypothetical protein
MIFDFLWPKIPTSHDVALNTQNLPKNYDMLKNVEFVQKSIFCKRTINGDVFNGLRLESTC